MSQRTLPRATGRRPLRSALLLTLLAGILLALRAAVADKGGFYDPAHTQR